VVLEALVVRPACGHDAGYVLGALPQVPTVCRMQDAIEQKRY
jgi:hypothetical protein